jgi:hypothetical protein
MLHTKVVAALLVAERMFTQPETGLAPLRKIGLAVRQIDLRAFSAAACRPGFSSSDQKFRGICG